MINELKIYINPLDKSITNKKIFDKRVKGIKGKTAGMVLPGR